MSAANTPIHDLTAAQEHVIETAVAFYQARGIERQTAELDLRHAVRRLLAARRIP